MLGKLVWEQASRRACCALTLVFLPCKSFVCLLKREHCTAPAVFGLIEQVQFAVLQADTLSHAKASWSKARSSARQSFL